MARIRSVHPGLWTDESFVSMSPLARLFAIGLWNECDDQGVFQWKPIQLRMRLLPADNADVNELLAELMSANVVRQFTVNGSKYGAVRNFQKYQRPKKPNQVFPLPDELRTYVGSACASSEPEHDKGGPGSPPTPPISINGSPPVGNTTLDREASSSEPVPHRFGTGSRFSPQMEEGGGREGGKEEPPSLRSVPPRPDRGERLPASWMPDPECVAFAAKHGLDATEIAAQFRDYWHAKAGKDATKRDWAATWRTWCRREAQQLPARRICAMDARKARSDAIMRTAFDELGANFQGALLQ